MRKGAFAEPALPDFAPADDGNCSCYCWGSPECLNGEGRWQVPSARMALRAAAGSAPGLHSRQS